MIQDIIKARTAFQFQEVADTGSAIADTGIAAATGMADTASGSAPPGIALPITEVLESLLSQSFDSLCSTTVALSAGLHGASHGCRWASLTGRLASTRNPSCDSPHVGSIHVHARVHTNICARAPLKRDTTPLRSVNILFCGPDLELNLFKLF